MIVVSGATGLVGQALMGRLAAVGTEVLALSRDPERTRQQWKALHPRVRVERWAPELGAAPLENLDPRPDAIVHLAGEPVGEGRWTEERKRRIRDSRIVGTQNLVSGIASMAHPPKVLISASAVGYYGDRGDTPIDEQAGPGADFLAEVCAGWEAEARRARVIGVRVVSLRLGLVLSRAGGALPKMLTPFKLGVGGRLGDGRQWMPWIHIDDVVGLILWALENDGVEGPVNAVAPEPATNATFTRTLARTLGRPAIVPVPKIGLRLALGEMTNLLLSSQRVVPRVATELGYAFKFPELESALREAAKPAD